MDLKSPQIGFTRRELIAAGCVLLSSSVESIASGNFWNQKDSSNWTEDEVVVLTTRSPWAKNVRVDLKPKGKDAEGNRAPDPGASPFGVNRPEPGRTAAKAINATVTWESALPLFDAQHQRLPADFRNHYVIGVRDFPILVDAGSQRQSPQELLDWLKNSATLQAKSRDAVQAGRVATARDGALIMFGFLRELLPLTANDRDVDFVLGTEQATTKARFEPKEMMYHGQLAL
jgi:hypothetical protein